MTILTRTQAEALATFIVRVREDWSHSGVMAALEKSNIGCCACPCHLGAAA